MFEEDFSVDFFVGEVDVFFVGEESDVPESSFPKFGGGVLSMVEVEEFLEDGLDSSISCLVAALMLFRSLILTTYSFSSSRVQLLSILNWTP